MASGLRRYTEVETRCPACRTPFEDGDEVVVLPTVYVRVGGNGAYLNVPPDEGDKTVIHRACLERR